MFKNNKVTNSTRYSYDKKGNIKSTTYSTTTDNSKSFDMRFGFKSALTYIFIFLLICLVVRMSLGSEPLTFYSLLNWLQSFDNTGLQNVFSNISNGIQSLAIPRLPSVNIFGVTLGLAWISDIWNFFVNLEGVAVWLAGNLVYAVTFIIQFFRFVFVI